MAGIALKYVVIGMVKSTCYWRDVGGNLGPCRTRMRLRDAPVRRILAAPGDALCPERASKGIVSHAARKAWRLVMASADEPGGPTATSAIGEADIGISEAMPSRGISR